MKERVFVFVATVMLLVPLIGMLWYETDMSAENRVAAPFPKVTGADGSLNQDFFSEFDDYFNDHFAYRQEMATADAVLTAGVFSTSDNDQVVIGSDGWLYFEQTLDDYFCRNVLTDRGIAECARTLALLQEGAEEAGASFLFFIAPNKNSLYPEHMPGHYVKGEGPNNFEKLLPVMVETGISFVDLHAAFRNDERVLYHKLDTHWNNEGAAFACGLMQEALGKSCFDYREEPFTIEASHRGDLYRMLYPSGKRLDDNVVFEHGHSFVYTMDTESTEDFEIASACEGKDGNLLMFRDSYGNALIPFVADEYGKAFFSKAMPYRWDLLEEAKTSGAPYDTVVIELVERHIPSLHENLPVMAAPVREDLPLVPEEDAARATLSVREDGTGRVVVYGTVDAEYCDVDSLVYVRAEDSTYLVDYEAFPVAYRYVGQPEEEREGDADFHFAMYLDEGALEKGGTEFSVITLKEGEYHSSGVIGKY